MAGGYCNAFVPWIPSVSLSFQIHVCDPLAGHNTNVNVNYPRNETLLKGDIKTSVWRHHVF